MIISAPMEYLQLRIIPDACRPTTEPVSIKAFSEIITAVTLMGLEALPAFNAIPRTFAQDVLIIGIEGPSRPQLTLVDAISLRACLIFAGDFEVDEITLFRSPSELQNELEEVTRLGRT